MSIVAGESQPTVGAFHVAAEVSILRLYALRLVYLLNFSFLGFTAWSAILRHEGPWDAVRGAALCFWAALAALAGLGIRYPLRMLPLLFLQLLYKAIWLAAVAPALSSSGQSTEIIRTFAIAAIVDVLVIPWLYVVRSYLRAPAERWT